MGVERPTTGTPDKSSTTTRAQRKAATVDARKQGELTPAGGGEAPVSDAAARVWSTVAARGAMFVKDLAVAADLDDDGHNAAIGELVAAGRLTADGFAGLRAIVSPRRSAPASVSCIR